MIYDFLVRHRTLVLGISMGLFFGVFIGMLLGIMAQR